jgi:hypothetical protein
VQDLSNVIIIPIMSYIFGLFCGILICCLCIALAEFTEKPSDNAQSKSGGDNGIA